MWEPYGAEGVGISGPGTFAGLSSCLGDRVGSLDPQGCLHHQGTQHRLLKSVCFQRLSLKDRP